MKARLINFWRRRFPHPAAIARRVESERSRAAAKRRADTDWQRILETAASLKSIGKETAL